MGPTGGKADITTSPTSSPTSSPTEFPTASPTASPTTEPTSFRRRRLLSDLPKQDGTTGDIANIGNIQDIANIGNIQDISIPDGRNLFKKEPLTFSKIRLGLIVQT